MLTTLEQAKANGARIISINPLPETGLTRFKNPQDFLKPLRGARTLLGSGSLLADLHLPVRVGGDVALLKGIMKELLALEDEAPGTVIDRDFIAEYGEGFEAFLADLEAEGWDAITQQSGVGRDLIAVAAAMLAGSPRIICCWAMGLTQHREAVAAIQQVVNLLLMRGAIGPPRRRHLPRTRPQQRSGRPHHGHLGTAPRSLPRPPR